MESHSSPKKKKILSFGTTWMHLEDSMLSKISQTQKYCTIQEKRAVMTRDEEDGGKGAVCQRVQTFSYMMRKFPRSNLERGN